MVVELNEGADWATAVPQRRPGPGLATAARRADNLFDEAASLANAHEGRDAMNRLPHRHLTVSCLLLASCLTLAHAAPPPARDALTELTAAQWGAEADGGWAAVYNDTVRRVAGSASIRFETNGCFDTRLWAPLTQDAGWDFLGAGVGGLAFWVYTHNTNHGFQGPSPWLHICTTPADYIELRPRHDFLDEARGQWVLVTVPLNGNDVWTSTPVGNPDMSNVNYIEIHGDTWECAFTMWIDDLRFDLPFAPPEGLVAIAGNQQVSLSWRRFNDLTGQFHHYAIYRRTQPFTTVQGLTPLHTIPDLNNTSWVDSSATNATTYYYAVTAVLTGGFETTEVNAVGPRTPRDETDLQVTCIARTPRYPRYWPLYTGYWVTEPNGFGPYYFTAATGLGGGQTPATQRWPNLGDPVTYVATVRNRGTNAWSGTLNGVWEVDGLPAGTSALPASLQPGDTAELTFVLNWDNAWHEISFTLDVPDARLDNNRRSLHTKSAPFLTYVDVTFIENFRENTPNFPQAATDDMIDWLQRHADEMNRMFATATSRKRVHYDVLQVLHDHQPDPNLPTIYFGVFPYRYRGNEWSDPRLPGYYHPDVDIDYGLCHELSHQLGLIDIYQLDLPGDRNEVSGQGYSAVACLMHGCSPFYSMHSALAMSHWSEIVHGYYGQYMYCIPRQMRLRVLDYNNQPLSGATVTMYQMVERPGVGKVITQQAKAQGVTNAAGEWTLPNVPINPSLVPPTHGGDLLHDNPFGYLAVVGTNGLLHFKIEYDEFVDYAWLDITEANIAYWQGQSDLATFERRVAIGGGTQFYPPADLAELNAANWATWSEGGTASVSDDTTRKQVGQASIRFDSDGGADNYLRYPLGILAKWNLSDVQYIRFWLYAHNTNSGGFQSQSPWLRLGSFQDGYFQWKPTWDILNLAINRWTEFVIPIAGDATWQRTVGGNPSLAKINYFQLHADTWGAGFTLWLDGVNFQPQPHRPGDLNCDGQVDFADINPFVLALSDWERWKQLHPDCPPINADINGDGQYGGTNGFGDINPFVNLLSGAR